MQTITRSAALALALVSSALGSAAAAPIGVYTSYFVTGSAAAGAPGDGRSGEYGCNRQPYVAELAGCGINTQPGFNRVSEGGATVYSGTSPGSAGMTAFEAGVRANGFHTEFPGNVPTVVLEPSFSQAYAAADLSKASLRASVSNNANLGFVAGSARADLHDSVHVQVGGAGADSITRLHFQFAVDGTVVNDGQTTIFGEQGGGHLETVLRLDQTDSGNGGGLDYWLAAFGEWSIVGGTLQSNNTSVDNRGAHVGGSWTSVGLDEMLFEGWMDVIGESATFNPTLSLSLDCSISLQCDYSHTARFSFVGLPTNVTYSSASGVFLTAGTVPTDPGSVPEPASAALVLAALAGLRGAARRCAAA
jgi:hypothetical protein